VRRDQAARQDFFTKVGRNAIHQEGNFMERNISKTTLAMVLLTLAYVCLAPAARAQDEPGCSNASVAGKWGFTTNGTVVGIGPRNSLGIFTLDAAGNLLNGKATASLNGNVTDETFSGTFKVNPDCTGKLAIQIFDLSGNKILAATLDLVFDNNVRELRAIFTSAVLPNGSPLATVITVQAKRLFSDR
jgi:hypothetical protein